VLLTPIPQVTESKKVDLSAQVGIADVTQDSPDPGIEDSKQCLDPPGANEDAYIQASASLDVTMGPLILAQSGLVSDVSALESPMDIQHNDVFVQSELETDLGCNFDATHCTVTEPISQLCYVVAFSHLSSRHASPPTVSNSPSSEIHRALSPGQTDLSASCADVSSNGPPNSSLFEEPVSVTFARPISPLPPSSPGFTNDYSMECSDRGPIPPFPSRSSPVPGSSPPNFFTSSPSRHVMQTSPPTSPSPAEKLPLFLLMGKHNPLKRPRSPETATTPANDQNGALEEQPAKRKARHTCNSRVCDTQIISRS